MESDIYIPGVAAAAKANWREDSTATVLARLTARDGSGSATGVNGEGNWLQQADISTITCAVFDLDSTTPSTAINEPTVTIADVILDTPVTTNTLWTKDLKGYNFIHDLGPANFPTGNHTYRVEYTVTLGSGTVFHLTFEGIAQAIHTS